MSTATTTTSPNITHLPRTAHPLPLKEQAFTLHCHGLRSPAIAAELGVPERTIRAWIAAALDDLKDDLQINRRQQLLLAVERQNAVTAAAWRQFEAETAARDALLDAALETLHAAADTQVSTTPAASAHSAVNLRLPHLPASTPAPRYLSLIIQANKEANRLLGLHTLARLELLTPADPAIPAESATAPHTRDTAAESATATPSADPAIPAESATAVASGLAAGIQPAHLQPPASLPIASTAETQAKIPAESATAHTPGSAARLQPAKLQSPIAGGATAFPARGTLLGGGARAV